MMGVHLLKYGLCTNILILCDDIASNPGSVDLMVDLSSSDSSFYSASDKENYILWHTLILDLVIKVCELGTGMSIILQL